MAGSRIVIPCVLEGNGTGNGSETGGKAEWTLSNGQNVKSNYKQI